MVAWLDRLVGAVVNSLGGVLVLVLGVSQLFASAILVKLLISRSLPDYLATSQTAWRLWALAGFLFALGASLLALGAWMIRRSFREQKFNL